MGKYSKIFNSTKEHIICNVCKWIAKRPANFSTSLLRYHLKANHKDLLKEFDKRGEDSRSSKRKAISDSAGTTPVQVPENEEKGTTPKKAKLDSGKVNIDKMLTTWSSEGAMTIKAERALMQFICASTLPLSIVESSGLKNFIAIVAPRFKVKSRFFYTRKMLNSLYDEYKTKVSNMLRDAKFISFTSDAWSSSDNRHSLISLTAHYVDSGMVPRFAIVAATPIRGRHTAENLRSLLAKALTTFDITAERVHLIVRDAASAMKKTTTLLGMRSTDCFAHKLQLAVKDGLKCFGCFEAGEDNIICRLSKIVRKIRKSGVDKDSFSDYQQFLDLPENALVKGVDVRWNSIFEMMVRFLDNRKAVELFLVDHPSYPSIDQSDWTIIKKLVEVLKPLAVATKFVQHREHAPISVVIPLYKVILKELSDTSSMRNVKEAIAEGLKRRMEEEGYEDSEEFVIATMVDPRFKDTYFAADKRGLFLVKLEELATLSCGGGSSPPSDVPESDFENPFLRFWSETPCAAISPSPTAVDAKAKAFTEMEDYLSRKPCFNMDPFEFWRNEVNAAKYPLIRQLAMKYLSAPSTSAESERLFSTAGIIVNDLRKRLSPENLEKLLFLHHNIQILGF